VRDCAATSNGLLKCSCHEKRGPGNLTCDACPAHGLDTAQALPSQPLAKVSQPC